METNTTPQISSQENKMTNNIQIFENKEFGKIRTILINGETWFVAKDVCDILNHTNPSVAISRLDEDDKRKFDPKESLGSNSNQDFWAINESGLYSLILTSNKSEAKLFKKWITSEVLPSIRKSGSYQIKPMSQLEMMQVLLNQGIEQEKRQKELEERMLLLEAKTTSTNIEFFSISGYCKIKNRKLTLQEATKFGKEASKLSKELGIQIGKIPDQKYGSVQIYHQDVLEEIFKEITN